MARTFGDFINGRMPDAVVLTLDDPPRTEVILADEPTVWVNHSASVELGYAMETGDLIAVRIYGYVKMRPERV